MNLSTHFTLREMTRSEAAERQGVDNTPSEKTIENLKALCVAILEPLRAHFGKPINVSSAYRSPEVNKLIGGSPTGQHPVGEAVDFEVFGISNIDLAKAVISLGLPFDQLILEGYSPGKSNSGWVHCSHKRNGTNRGEVLTATFNNGKATYTRGI